MIALLIASMAFAADVPYPNPKSAADLAKIVKQYPAKAKEENFRFWAKRAYEQAVAGECSVNTSRPCSHPDSHVKQFKALGYKATREDWVDEATFCNLGPANGRGGSIRGGDLIGPCPPGQEVKREGCKIFWCKN